MPLKYLVPILLSVCLASCNYSSKDVRVYKVKKKQSSQVTKPEPVSGINWEAPESWTPKAVSSMHLAAFDIPVEGGNASLSIMTLAGDGGGMLLNVNRWLNQLDLAPVEEGALPGMSKQIESINGPFTVFTIKNPTKPEGAFNVAVVQMAEQTLFVKMVAPLQEIDTLWPVFETFCQSIKFER